MQFLKPPNPNQSHLIDKFNSFAIDIVEFNPENPIFVRVEGNINLKIPVAIIGNHITPVLIEKKNMANFH